MFDLRAGGPDRVLPRGGDRQGVNGSYLGLTLRAERGEQVVVNVRNGLQEATTLHWHGMHLPARMDGGPHQMIEPGGVWSPTWRVDQPAATLWYHPHGRTEDHVYWGPPVCSSSTTRRRGPSTCPARTAWTTSQ